MKELGLFAGIGGFSLGLEWAGFETVAFCESDRKCRKVLKKHWPTTPIFIDVESLTYEKLKKKGIAKIDVITGGFPCQDISLAGKGAGINGDRSGLWREFARLIGEIRPRYAIVENVAALRGRGLDRVLRDLAAIGYDAEWHCIPASAVGAPHQRDRIWIIAYRDGQGCEQRNKKTGREKGYKPCGGGRIGRSENVANSDKFYGNGRRYGTSQVCRKQQKKTKIQSSECNVSDTASTRLKTPGPDRLGEEAEGKTREIVALSNRWHSEPPICGVAHGFPGRVDRLKQLGNAVVPQIPYLIGMAIMEYENSLNSAPCTRPTNKREIWGDCEGF